MAVNRDDVVGRPTGKSTVTVERGPVSVFAKAVTESSPIYQSTDAARADRDVGARLGEPLGERDAEA